MCCINPLVKLRIIADHWCIAVYYPETLVCLSLRFINLQGLEKIQTRAYNLQQKKKNQLILSHTALVDKDSNQ